MSPSENMVAPTARIGAFMAGILSGLTNSYNIALGQCAAALAIKIGALNLLTVRSRLITGDMSSGKEGGISQKADQNMSPYVVQLFKTMMCAFGPTFTTQKLVQLVNNAKENEPFFIGLAAAVALAGNPPAWGASGLYLYGFCRYVQGLFFLVEFPDELLPYQVLIRATPYLIGVFTMFRLAGSQLLK